MEHLHHAWLREAGLQIQRDYERLHAKARMEGRAQEVGHENEAVWAQFLTHWLPPQYEVATRKYIIGTNQGDAAPFETDLVIFHPGYPRKLREESHVMAAGVAAAFSTKLTLMPSGLREAAEQSAKLQRAVYSDTGHARNELWKPYIFGVLAASHPWKSANSNPQANMNRLLVQYDYENSQTPAESVDVVCVSDLGTWAKVSSLLPNPAELGRDEVLVTAHVQKDASTMSPLAHFISVLYELLSWRNEDLRGLAHDFRVTTPNPNVAGKLRDWPAAKVLSHQALMLMREAPAEINHPDSPHQGAF